MINLNILPLKFSNVSVTVCRTGYSRWSWSIKNMPKQNNLAKILKVTSESKTYYHTQFEGQIRFTVWDTSPGWVPITLPCIKNVCINVHMFKKVPLCRKIPICISMVGWSGLSGINQSFNWAWEREKKIKRKKERYSS